MATKESHDPDPTKPPTAAAADAPTAAPLRPTGQGRANGSRGPAATTPAPAALARSTRSATSRPTSRPRSSRPTAPDAKELLANGWRLFEQRRPGAAEKEFRAALALDAELPDARVGIGMARLSAGNAEGAREELSAVVAAGEPRPPRSRNEGAKDAFSKPEAQPYIRAAHALGCLAYDEDRFEDAREGASRGCTPSTTATSASRRASSRRRP